MQMPEFQQWFLQLFQIIGNLSVGVAIVAAVIGYNSWQREHSGRARYDLGRRLTVLAYQLRSEFIDGRKIYLFYDPLIAYRDDPWNKTHFEMGKQEHDVALNKIQQLIGELFALTWEARFVLGHDLEPFIRELERLYDELFGAVQEYYFLPDLYADFASEDRAFFGRADYLKRFLYPYPSSAEFSNRQAPKDSFHQRMTTAIDKLIHEAGIRTRA